MASDARDILDQKRFFIRFQKTLKLNIKYDQKYVGKII